MRFQNLPLRVFNGCDEGICVVLEGLEGTIRVSHLRQTLLGAGMDRKDDRHFGGNGIDRAEELAKLLLGLL